MKASSVGFFLLWAVASFAGGSCRLWGRIVRGVHTLSLDRLRKFFLVGRRRGRAGMRVLHLGRRDKGGG